MRNRIKQIRADRNLSQSEFGARFKVSGAAVSRWESGERAIPDLVIQSICREFNVNERWLRTGAGDPSDGRSREDEMATMVKKLMQATPASFQASLITTLLRFDPEGPEWALLKKIYDSVAAEMEKAPDP